MKSLYLMFAFALTLSMFSVGVMAQVNSVSLVVDPVFGSTKQVTLISVGTIYSDSVQFNRIDESTAELSSQEPSSAQYVDPFSLSWKTDKEYTYYSTVLLKQLNYVDIRKSEFKWLGWSDADARTWRSNNCYDFNRDGQINFIEKKNVFSTVLELYCAGNGGVAGDVLKLSSPRPFWESTFTFGNGKETITEKLSSSGEAGLSKNIQSKVFIRFSGLGLLSYPTQVNEINLFKSQSGGQVLFDSYRFTEVTSIYQNDAISYVQNVFDGRTTEATEESRIKNSIGQLSTWTVSSDFPRTKVSFDGAQVKLTLDERISFQNFVVYLNGDWVRVTIPIGIPDITGFTKDFTDLEATKTGTFTVKVKNIGTATATFQAKFSCGSVSIVQQTQILSNIAPNSEATTSFQVSSQQISTKQTDSCTVTVTDTTDTSKSDSASISFSIIPRPVCSTGEQIQSFEGGVWVALECVDGKFSKNVVTCKQGEVLTTDVFGKFNGCKSEKQSSCANGAINFPACDVCKDGFELQGGVLGIGGVCKQKEGGTLPFDLKLIVPIALGLIGIGGLVTRRLPINIALILLIIAALLYVYFFYFAYLVIAIIAVIAIVVLLAIFAPHVLLRAILLSKLVRG